MKYLITSLLVLLIWLPCLDACTMQPSVWHQIQGDVKDDDPSVYALTEAFFQIRKKYEKEMRASKLPIKPLMLVGAWNGEDEGKINSNVFDNFVEATNVVWDNLQTLPYEKLSQSLEGLNESDFKTFNDKYMMSIVVSSAKTSTMNMIDLNPQYFELLRFALRDELKIFVRIADNNNFPIFLDEFDVSPTLIIDPFLSPIGGFFIRVEKNSSYPAIIDFGTVNDGTEHVLRVNNAFYQPFVVPPLSEFKSELVNRLEKEENDEQVCNSLVFAIKSLDYEFFKIVLETYPEFDVNTKTSEGKTPIHYACEVSAVEMVETLLNKKADPTILSLAGENALHEAVDIDALCTSATDYFPDLTICPLTIPQLLVDAGVDVKQKNSQGDSALHVAARNGLVGVIATIINAGADVNEKNNNEDTPLHVVGKNMSKACAQVLLSFGANTSLKNKQGLTPYDAAMKAVNAHLVNAINEYVENNK